MLVLTKTASGDSMSTNTDWRIGDVLKAAGEKQVGFKLAFFIAVGLYFLIGIPIAVAQAVTVGTGTGVASSLIDIFINILLYPLGLGFGLLGIRRALGKDTPVSTLWEPYSQFIPLIVMFVLMCVLIVAGFFLLILPGIYLAVAYSFAPYLIVEKNMGVWAALVTSRNAIPAYWWRYFGLMLILLLLCIVGTVPILIGLIWALPIMFIAIGEVFVATFETASAEGLGSDAD
jgi:uncharacterized membrane protein